MPSPLSSTPPLRLAALALFAFAASCTPPSVRPSASVPPPSAVDQREWTDAVVRRAQEAQALGDAAAATTLYDHALTAWESFAGEKASWKVAAANTVDMHASHGSAVVAASPDGRWVALNSRGATLYDTTRWSIVARFAIAGLRHVAFAASSRYLFALAQNHACRFEVTTASKTCVPAEQGASSWLAASPGKTSVAFPCGPDLCVWNATAAAAARIPWPKSCPAPQRWIDDSTIEGAAPEASPCYVDVRSGARVTPRKGIAAAAPDAASLRERVASRDGRRIVWAHDRSIDVVDAATRRQLRRLPLDCRVAPPVVLPDGRVWVGCSHKFDFAVIDPDHPERSVTIRPPDASHVPSFGLSPDGSQLATLVRMRLSILSLRDGTRSAAKSLPFGPGPGVPLLFGPDGLLAISREDVGLVVEASTGETVFHRGADPSQRRRLIELGFATEPGQSPVVMLVTQFHPDGFGPGARIPGTVEFLRARDNTTVHPSLSLPGAYGAVLAANGNALFLQPALGAPLEQLNLPTGKKRPTLDTPLGSFPTADGRYTANLAAPGPDSTLLIVDSATGTLLTLKLPVRAHHIVGWTEPGPTLALMSYDTDAGRSRLVLVDAVSGTIRVDHDMRAICRGSVISADGAVFVGDDEYSRHSLVLKRISEDGLVGLHFESDGVSYVATDEKGGVSTFGPRGRDMVECQAGPWVLPFEVCEHRFPRVGFFAPSASAVPRPRDLTPASVASSLRKNN